MDQIVLYILTVSYCLAPEGKTACEPTYDQYHFADANHCVLMRRNLVEYMDSFSNVILNKEKTRCDVAPVDIDKASWLLAPDRETALSEGKERLAFAEKKYGD